MSKLFQYLSLATCLALASACSNEVDLSSNPNFVGKGEAGIVVKMNLSGAPKSYASGDVGDEVLPGVALDAEKEIQSIAFFAYTTGGNSMFLSTEETLTEHGFTEGLAAAADNVKGHYTAQFKIKSSDFGGNTTLVAVANYAENGLVFDPSATVPTFQELKAMLTQALADDGTAILKTPLLMSVYLEQALTDGSTTTVDFKMERIVGRIDVVNKAYAANTADGFVLTSARLLSAPATGVLLSGSTPAPATFVNTAAETNVTTVPEVVAPDPVDAYQTLAPIYVYENANAKNSKTATIVEVTGTYKGTPYKKQVAFKKEDLKDAPGDVVPIVRNTRYVLQINPGEGVQEPVFNVLVEDWTDQGNLDVDGSEFPAPEIVEDINNIATLGAGATWDGATKTLTISKAMATSTLEFTLKGNQDSDLLIESEYEANAAPLAKAITVERGELVGYADADAGRLSRTYKITVPAMPEGSSPVKTNLTLFNTSNEAMTTTITVVYAPFFVGDIKGEGGTMPVIDPATGLVDLTQLSGSGSFSFLASSGAGLNAPVLTNKGITNNFYSISESAETDQATINKYGPGTRYTVSYQTLSDKTEFAEIAVTDKDPGDAKKVYVKSFKKPYALATTIASNSSALTEGTDKLYLSVNNADHGVITYTVYDKIGNTIILSPTATYHSAFSSSPTEWATQGVAIQSNTEVEAYAPYKLSKRTVKVTLPTVIKNPVEVTSFKVGIAGETPLKLVPVYPTGGAIVAGDKVMQPVLYNGTWFAPVNVGQTTLSIHNNNPTTVYQAGNIFQWGKKTPLKHNDSSNMKGPVSSAAAAGSSFITNEIEPYDWLYPQNNALWNSGTESNPVKVTDNDPCPSGWRVPTKAEFSKLTGTHTWVEATSGAGTQSGLLTVNGTANNQKLSFLAVGLRGFDGVSYNLGMIAFYWTSSVSGDAVSTVASNGSQLLNSTNSRSHGMPVRCVQE